MSAMLQRTWNFLSHSLSSAVSPSGPRWSSPIADSAPEAHLPHGLASFLRALHLCATREDEERLVREHMAHVEARLREADLASAAIADALVRAVAVHMLGYDVSFVHIYAIQLAQKGNILEKKMGYLVCSLLMQVSDELTLLLINTIIKDLSSKNVLEVSLALTAATHLTPLEMMPLVLPLLMDKSSHTKDFIRKKALVCMQQMILRDQSLTPAVECRVLQCLADPDPGVVAVAVQVTRTIVEFQDATDLQLVPSMIEIQGQILGKKLPEEYNYRGIPAPWFQVEIITLIGLMLKKAEWDSKVYDSVSAALLQSMEAANPKDTIGQAIIYQCIITISIMNGHESDVVKNSKALFFINKFLQSKHNNVRYMGLEALENLMSHCPPNLTSEQQDSVLDCLNHYDDSIQKKTLSLLYALATESNAKTICDKLLEHVKTSSDDYQKEGLVKKIVDLMERFNPSLDQYVGTVMKLLQCSFGEQKENLLVKLKTSLTQSRENGDNDEIAKVGRNLVLILEKAVSSDKPPVILLRIYIWCLSQQFGNEAPSSSPKVALEICRIGRSSDLPQVRWQPVIVSCLDALLDLAQTVGDACPDVLAFVDECAESSNEDQVVDLCSELRMLLRPTHRGSFQALRSDVATLDDFTMSYLDNMIADKLENNSTQPYFPAKNIIARQLKDENVKVARQSSSEATKKVGRHRLLKTPSESSSSRSRNGSIFSTEDAPKESSISERQSASTSGLQDSEVLDLSKWTD